MTSRFGDDHNSASCHYNSSMSLLCHSCGQVAHPSLSTWQTQIKNSKSTNASNSYIRESSLFSSIANDLDKYIKGLKKELKAATEALKSARELSAPVSRLSDDILLCIFEETILPPGISQHHLTLARVCKRWRNIIVSSPKFWTTITIPPSFIAEQGHLHQAPRALITQLERVGKSLTLSLECPGPLPSKLQKFLRPVWARITCVRVQTNAVDADSTVQAYISLPHLKKLELNLEDPSDIALEEHCNCDNVDFCGYVDNPRESYCPADDAYHYEDCPRFEASGLHPITIDLSAERFPMLRDLQLIVERPFEALILPFAQLRALVLRVRFEMWFNFYPILAQLEKIETLKLDLGRDFCYAHIGGDKIEITLPCLRSLTIVGYDRYDHNDLPFKFPRQLHSAALEKLELVMWGGYKKLVRALENPRLHSITELDLIFMDDPDTVDGTIRTKDMGDIIDCLWHFKSLEVFLCRLNGCGDDMLEALALPHPNSSNEYLFPQLRELDILRALFTPVNVGLLRKMLQARVSCVDTPVDTRKPLQTILMDFESPTATARDVEPTQEANPSQYNDGATSVMIRMLGQLKGGGLEKSLKAVGLA